MKPRILVAEHDQNLVNLLEYALDKEGMEIILLRDPADTARLIHAVQPDIIILGQNFTGPNDGLIVCQKLRADPTIADIPIIITGDTDDVVTERIKALELGADDYLNIPFDIKELVARINALQRRSDPPQTRQILRANSIEVDLDRWTVSVEGRHLMLTNKEFSLLRELLEAKGRVLSRDALLERVWGHEKELNLTTRTVDIHLSRLRRKLGPARDQILTIRNVGYRMDFSPAWIVPRYQDRREN